MISHTDRCLFGVLSHTVVSQKIIPRLLSVIHLNLYLYLFLICKTVVQRIQISPGSLLLFSTGGVK